MAKPGKVWLPLDANYFDDPRVIDAGSACLLHLAAMTASKRLLSDGRLTRRQLHRIAPDSVPEC